MIPYSYNTLEAAAPAAHVDMTPLVLIIGLMFATIIMVGVGDRLKLPYPVLMVIVSVAIAFVPGFPYVEIPPELILPLFLPPLLYATAMKTSWSVFRVRWRSILLLAVALVFLTVAIVAGATWILIPSMGVPAAIALGAMVAPPDPVAVESVAGRVHMPRRLITVLQSEGLFNDAAAIVIFQAAVAAAVRGKEVDADVIVQFLVGAAVAVIMGLAMGFLTKMIHHITASSTARSAVTLVVPFAVYIAAEHFHASGVIAVVVTALEIRRNSRPHDAEERITSKSFWEVVELIATGVAFGLVGLEIRHVIAVEGADIYRMLVPAAIICVIVIVIRALWLSLLAVGNRRRNDGLPPTSGKDVVVLTWSGMRGLATLALALALPTTLADGTPFPDRDQIIVIACAVLLTTLVFPGLTLPWLMKKLKMAESPSVHKEMKEVLARRSQEAALSALRESTVIQDLSESQREILKTRMRHLSWDLTHDETENPKIHALDAQQTLLAAQTIALDAARVEIMNARNEVDMDPEIVDEMLHEIDLRTMVIED